MEWNNRKLIEQKFERKIEIRVHDNQTNNVFSALIAVDNDTAKMAHEKLDIILNKLGLIHVTP